MYYKLGFINIVIPIDDTGDGQFMDIDKSSFFMRWIKDNDLINNDDLYEFLFYRKKEVFFKHKNLNFSIHLNDLKNMEIYKYNKPNNILYYYYFNHLNMLKNEKS